MFGSDWPVCRRAATLREWVGALKEIVGDRSEEERRKLLAENAMEFYGLA
jgi:L-fuconolactonase